MQTSESFFSEIYSTYFNVLAAILRHACKGTLTRAGVEEIVRSKAFADSCLTIPQALADSTWPLLLPDYTTPLMRTPQMPLTLLQKRWLKSLLADARLALFDVDARGLEDVEPLFTPQQLVYFDRYNDGDDFSDPAYKKHFALLLAAIGQGRLVQISFTNARGGAVTKRYRPLQLEYSAKDDKLRLRALHRGHLHSVNLGRIQACEMLGEAGAEEEWLQQQTQRCELTVLLTDERNALERAMLHFSHLEKVTERIDDAHYRLRLMYNKSDETEMVIRILSFGPLLVVQQPQSFIGLLRERIKRQLRLTPPGGSERG